MKIWTDHFARQRRFGTAAFYAAVSVLVACGGGSGGDSPPLETSTDALVSNAAANVGSSLDPAFDGAVRLTTGESSSVDGEVLNSTGSQIWNDDTQRLINASLRLDDDEGNAARSGNRISITPDPVDICQQQALSLDADQAEIQRCETLIGQMIVQIDASSETAGTVTYLFRDQPLFTVGYSDNADSFRVNLATMLALVRADAELRPDEVLADDLVDSASGEIEVTATVSNVSLQSEQGEFALNVVTPVSITDSNPVMQMTLGTGTLFSMSVNGETDSGVIELDTGALNISGDSEGRTNELDMAGLSARLAFDALGNDLVVSNLSLGDGPLRVLVDNSEALNLGLERFGFTITADGEEMLLTGDLNFSLLVNQILDDGSVSNMLLGLAQATAPSGTRLRVQPNSSLLVVSGGPLFIRNEESDGEGGTINQQVTVNENECVLNEEQLAIVACE